MDERMSESEFPSAAEVIAASLNTEIVGHSGDYNGGRLTYSRSLGLAIQGLDALREAGWIVEKLPEPDHREEATDDENGRTDYEAGDVSVFDDGEIHVFGAVWEPAAVRHFGLSLIAAAAVSLDGGSDA